MSANQHSTGISRYFSSPAGLVSRANMAAAPSLLKLGDEFLTWAEFKAALDNYQETTHAELSKISSKKAILYGLHKIKGISMEAAQQLMDKGPERSPEETWYRD
ncbi:hypothetical protein Bbelb_074320 [Branchiostoma belcheri]|nr:hypothetical protein Bbelb_074320 [Branchiostoma belcheri]